MTPGCGPIIRLGKSSPGAPAWTSPPCAATPSPSSPPSNGPADYALFVDGQLLGILEAKKVTVNPQNVLEQAKRYAEGATQGAGNWNGFRVPFLYASNGEVIWHLDVRPAKPVSRIISHFHTAPALDALFARNPKPAHDWLLDTPPDLISRLRDYQRRCIIATEQALISGRRELLLALATGTGKTFLTVAQIYRLLKSGLVRRILFLVDRKALAAQAVREFNAFNTPQGNKFPRNTRSTASASKRKTSATTTPSTPRSCPTNTSPPPSPATPSFTSPPSSAWPGTSSAPRAASPNPPATPNTRPTGRDRIDISILSTIPSPSTPSTSSSPTNATAATPPRK